jgi:hypothetical protein
METDILALLHKLKLAVEYRTKVELATSLVFSESNALALTGADNRVDAAQANLVALMKSALRKP